MSILKSSWGDMPINNSMELRAFIVKLKEAVASEEMQQYWPIDAPFATKTEISDVDENGSWPADYLEWYFLLTTNRRCYKLSAETYHGTGGYWELLDLS